MLFFTTMVCKLMSEATRNKSAQFKECLTEKVPTLLEYQLNNTHQALNTIIA